MARRYLPTFKVTAADQDKIDEWLRTVVYPPIVEQQLKDPRIAGYVFTDEETGVTYPYGGAIGGGLTYEFSPTSIGTAFWVKYPKPQGKKKNSPQEYFRLDLSDYDSW
jgi:hypothetical protein